MSGRIGDYGLIGNTRTAALVGASGSVDWLCVPRFDGPPLFGSLVDPVHGGRWSIRPSSGRVESRRYTPDTATLTTTWHCDTGTALVSDTMIADATSSLLPKTMLVRRVACTSRSVAIDHVFDPRLGLPGRPPSRVRAAAGRLLCDFGSVAVALTVDRDDLELRPGRRARLTLHAPQTLSFVLAVADREPAVLVPAGDAHRLVTADERWWHDWSKRFSCDGPHADHIMRSLITLRLLTYAPSGAPVAAPTTSIPAPPGSDQTWDYRFSWPRDASIGVDAFLAFGSAEEPQAFLQWFINASRVTRPRLHVLYDLDGQRASDERTVDAVDGYRGGRPVRVGNGAAGQHQLDVYGWVLDAAWQLHCAGYPLERPEWRALRSFADFIADHWHEPDSGIWEEREAPRQFVHSKLMALAGLDRALRLSASYPAGTRPSRWHAARNAMSREIVSRGFDERLRSFTRTFDSDDLDAAVLSIAAFDVCDTDRMSSTLDAVRARLGAGGPLLYRTLRHGRPVEAAFAPCSFWLVAALARMGRLAEAEQTFDELCLLSTPLGLYAEQIDPSTNEHVGNFPQAFTHATLVQAAAALNEARRTLQESARTARAPRSRRAASATRS